VDVGFSVAVDVVVTFIGNTLVFDGEAGSVDGMLWVAVAEAFMFVGGIFVDVTGTNVFVAGRKVFVI
jgi:hypothetical protein